MSAASHTFGHDPPPAATWIVQALPCPRVRTASDPDGAREAFPGRIDAAALTGLFHE
jgi:hypothetical protein